jgi:hypothetical protein
MIDGLDQAMNVLNGEVDCILILEYRWIDRGTIELAEREEVGRRRVYIRRDSRKTKVRRPNAHTPALTPTKH